MKTGNHIHLLTIDRRIDMLKVVDLNRNEELSSASMSTVSGGEGITSTQAGDVMEDAADMFDAMGLTDAALDATDSACRFYRMTP
jgi:hypothetical protein